MEEDRLAVFPTRLRCLRLARGMTQQMVAENLNIHRTTYTKYETGKASPDQESLLTLARLFRVSVGYLLGQEDSICHTESALENGAGITTLSPQEQELLQTFRRLSEPEQKRLLAQAHARQDAARQSEHKEK